MADVGGIDLSGLPPWVSTAAGIAVTAGVFLGAMWGKWKSASLADPPKTHADEVVEKLAPEQLEILRAIRDASLASRDVAVLSERSMSAMREQVNRLVTCQEAIVEMMKKRDDEAIDDLKRENEASKLMLRLLEKEREMADRDDRRRNPHRD